jgi:hypothetical protein
MEGEWSAGPIATGSEPSMDGERLFGATLGWAAAWLRGRGASVVSVFAFAVVASGSLASPALAATAITVSSTAGTLGVAGAGECTLRDALVVADGASNLALSTSAEPGGSGAAADCAGEVSGTGAPYTITLAARATYSLGSVDNYWFGPDGLPPVSTAVTIVGNNAMIARASGARAFRFFYVSGGLSGIPAGHLTLQQLNVLGGLASGGNADGGGAGAGMGGAIFDQGHLALNGVTLTDNAAVGGSGRVAALDAYVQQHFSGDPGSAGGGIGRNAFVNGRGGGFGGPVPGALGGRGGARDDGSRHAGGGGGFRAKDRGADGKRGGRGGGVGGFGSNGGDGGNGGDAGFSHGVDGAPYNGHGDQFGYGGQSFESIAGPLGAGGGGGVGGGGGFGGGGGGFGGGGGYSQELCARGCPGGRGGFGGGGAIGARGGFGAGSGVQGDGGGAGAGLGGAVFSLFGTVVISDVTISHNLASGGPSDTSAPSNRAAGEGPGGGVFNLDGSVSVTGSTITDNVAQGRSPAGGGIYSLAFGNSISAGGATTAMLSVASSTLNSNTGAGGRDDDLALNRVNGRHANTSSGTITGMSTIGISSTSGGAVLAPAG